MSRSLYLGCPLTSAVVEGAGVQGGRHGGRVLRKLRRWNLLFRCQHGHPGSWGSALSWAGISPAAAPSPLPPTESKQQAPLLCSGALSPGEPENHLGGCPWLGVLPSSQMPADRPARRSEHRAFRAPRCCEPGARAGAQAGVCPQLQLPTGASRGRCRRQPPRVTAEGRAPVESASQEPVAQEAVGCDLGRAVFSRTARDLLSR